MKKAATIGGALCALLLLPVLGLYAAGSTLDREHSATVERTLDAPPAEVYRVITNIGSAAEWRDVDSIEMLSESPMRWRETADGDSLTFVEVERTENERFVSRIDDEQPFGGTWTIDVTPLGEGTHVTITEDGWIDPLIFRALARWGWGYDASALAYQEQLAAHVES